MKSTVWMCLALILSGCADALGPEVQLAASYTLHDVTLLPGETPWQAVPTRYDVFRDGMCVRSLERGQLEIEDGSYSVEFSYDDGCSGFFPQVIREEGSVAVTGGGVSFTVDGLGPDSDTCGSWIVGATVELGTLVASIAHPCLGGAVWHFRFESDG